MLRDLDLLIPKSALPGAIRALRAPATHRVARRPSSGVETVCARSICTASYLALRSQPRLVQAADVLDRARPVTIGDGRAGIPAVEHQIIHLIGHSQIRHLGYAGRVTWHSRLEAAALVRWGREGIDWQAVLERLVAAGYRRPLLSFLLALNDGDPCAAPVTLKVDRLTTLQQRRIALQARSTGLGYVGSRIGWCVWSSGARSRSAMEANAEWPRIREDSSTSARRQGDWFEHSLERQRHLMHALPYLSWLGAQ